MSLTRYEKLEILGRGSYGSVHKVRRIDDSRVFALKEISLKGLSCPEEEKDILNESQVHLQLQHPNVICFIESVVEDGALRIVMEWGEGGDLANLIKKVAKSSSVFEVRFH
jgi:serine/threonine protein kinase